jgi:hypothetical protein
MLESPVSIEVNSIANLDDELSAVSISNNESANIQIKDQSNNVLNATIRLPVS